MIITSPVYLEHAWIDAAPDLKEIFDTLSQIYESCCVYGKQTPQVAVQEFLRRTSVIVEWNR